MDYNKTFNEALNNLVEKYRQGEIQLLSESDLQAHLFSECANLGKQKGFPLPLQVYAEKGVFGKRSKIDLVLGNNEVLVELKFEPVWEVGGQGRVFTTIRDAGGIGCGSVEEDLQKIKKYAREGKHSHFVMIDENSWHSKKIEQRKWRPINAQQGKAVLLHVYEKPISQQMVDGPL